MRIGFYTHYLDKYPKLAPSLYQIKLIENLQKMFRNIEIVLIHHKKSYHKIYKENEEAIIPKSPLLGEYFINKLNLDIIHFNAIPWSWRIFVNKIKCKKVVTVHGDIWWVEPELGYNKTIEALKRFIEPKVIKFFDRIIAVSYSIKNTLANYLKCPEEKIKVIYEGIDHSIFYPRTLEEVKMIKAKYRINEAYIFHVSVYSKIKNPNTLFKSFRLVKEEINGIKLVIAGNKWREKYEKKLNQYKLNKRDVIFLGWTPQEDLPALYSGAKVFFSPSYHESFGFPILEAMACGTPVIASNKYAIPEITGNAAILHEPNDYKSFANSIITLLIDETVRKKIKGKSIKQVEKFSWKNTAKETYMLYTEVINSDY